MARPRTVAAMLLGVLLGVLPGAFVYAGCSNACSTMPYPQLRNYEPAKEWCSSHNGHTVAKSSPPHREDDFLRPIFSELTATAPAIGSSFCSCIGTSTATTGRTSTATSTSTTAKTTTSASRTLTSTSGTSTGTNCGGSSITTIITTATTVTMTLSASTATVTTTISPSASTVTVTTTISPSASTATVTTTTSLSASTATVTTTISLSASTTTIISTVTASQSTTSACATTVTSTVTSSSHTTSTAATGPATCTPAGSPSGTCARAADYNSGTGPQLWAGAAASLDACAVLCAGEPGCLSLAYNPSGTLQCVLFNTATTGLTTTADSGSSTSFYDSTCFDCSGSAPLPPTDDNCSPALQPPSGAICGQSELSGGIPLFELNAPGVAAASTGACEQLCLATSSCLSFSFNGATCLLYSQNTFELELQGVIFPVDPGVAGSFPSYDDTCFVCRPPTCVCPVTKRDLARREASVSRREANVQHLEAELSRRMLEMADSE